MNVKSLMESFLIDESVDYVCIGPLKSVALASEQLERGDPAPECWSKPPSAQCGGTVLVHDVDMRVPALHGEWRAGRLFNALGGHVCGGMVWHESVGDCAGAAKLLHAMEDAGAPMICNKEPEEVLAQGVRFIGRYSWNDTELTKDGFLEQIQEEEYYYSVLASGPTCYFAPKEVVRETILPDIKQRSERLKRRVAEELKKVEGCEDKDTVAQNIFNGVRPRYGAAKDPYELGQYSLPDFTVYEGKCCDSSGSKKKGVGYAFHLHEYLFGRLWFDQDGNCKAFCFYTYKSPDYFGEMRVEDSPVCPALCGRIAYERGMNSYSAYAKVLSDIEDQEVLRAVFQQLTHPLQQAILRQARDCSLFEKIFPTKVVPLDANLFDFILCSKSGYSEPSLLLVIKCAGETILNKIAEREIAKFQTLSKEILEGKFDFKEAMNNMETDNKMKGSHLGYHLSEPTIVAELVQKYKYPVSSVLAEDMCEWPRSCVASAALEGYKDSLKILLDAGADIDETVGGDPWNAIVYAAYNAGYTGNDEILDIFRERFPGHMTWIRTDIPLKMKELPKMFSFGASIDAPLEYGSLENLIQKVRDDKGKNSTPGGFGAGFQGGLAGPSSGASVSVFQGSFAGGKPFPGANTLAK